MQNPKKSILTFSEELFFSSKSSYGQVENSTDYPAGKSFVKRPKTCGSIIYTVKRAQNVLLFSTKFSCGHVKLKFWKHRQIFNDDSLKFISVKCQKVKEML